MKKSHLQRYTYMRQGGIQISIPCTLVHERKSEFQTIDVIDTEAWGRCLILDGVVNTSSRYNDAIHESLYLVPFIYGRPKKNVLILGGGDLFGAKLILEQRDIERVDMIELDPDVIGIAKTFLHENLDFALDKRLTIHIGDAFEYIQQVDFQYDMVVVDMTDPVGISEQLFTDQFAKNIRRLMADNASLCTQCDSPDTIGENYYAVIRAYQHEFGSVRPFRVWIPAYMELFGRLLVSKETLYGVSLPKLPNWLSLRILEAMFEYHTVEEYREIEGQTMYKFSPGSSVYDWSIE